jgi:hypothetical protein
VVDPRTYCNLLDPSRPDWLMVAEMVSYSDFWLQISQTNSELCDMLALSSSSISKSKFKLTIKHVCHLGWYKDVKSGARKWPLLISCEMTPSILDDKCFDQMSDYWLLKKWMKLVHYSRSFKQKTIFIFLQLPACLSTDTRHGRLINKPAGYSRRFGFDFLSLHISCHICPISISIITTYI